jgi:hypothetical protein
MESLARAFDQPLDSPEHRDLAENGWIGGGSVTIRYWLGRLLHRNLFRESDDAVKALLEQYFINRGQYKGASLVADFQAWSSAAQLLRHHLELTTGVPSTSNPRLLAALDAVMTNPNLSELQLAKIAKTTEKQVARMTHVFVLRKIWKHRQNRAIK